MRALLRMAAASAAVALLAGCGSGAGGGGGPERQASSSRPDGGSEVVAVSLHRSGGLKPLPVTRVFAENRPPPHGYTQADVDAALAAADAFVRSGADVGKPPQNTCCDRYTYVVTLTFGDGTSSSYSTVDGVDEPASFERLLDALA
jgi:hypothetical protein